jgi:hypothetical protein
LGAKLIPGILAQAVPAELHERIRIMSSRPASASK